MDFGRWLLVASVPALTVVALLPLFLYRLFPPGVTSTPEAPAAARRALLAKGPLSRDEWITAIVFSCMIVAWVLGVGLRLTIKPMTYDGN